MRARKLGVFVLLLALVSPASAQTPTAEERAEAVLWLTVQKSNSIDDLQGFLDAYPNGNFAPLAKRRLTGLLEERRSSLAGSAWDGRMWFTTTFGLGSNRKPGKAGDPKARSYPFTLNFADNGVCVFQDNDPRVVGKIQGQNSADLRCMWNKSGDAVRVKVGKFDRGLLGETFYLTLDPAGNEMTGDSGYEDDRRFSNVVLSRRGSNAYNATAKQNQK